MSKRRMVGWAPLTVENTDAPQPSASSAISVLEPQPTPQSETQTEFAETSQSVPAEGTSSPAAEPAGAPEPAVQPVASGPIQDPTVPRRRMAGWQPLSVARDGAPVAATAAAPAAEAPA